MNAVAGSSRVADCLPTRDPPRATDSQLLVGLAHWRRRRWGRALVLHRLEDRDVLDSPTTPQHLVKCGACVGGQMEAIGDLDCFGCALLATFGICPSAIADDDLHTWVAA